MQLRRVLRKGVDHLGAAPDAVGQKLQTVGGVAGTREVQG